MRPADTNDRIIPNQAAHEVVNFEILMDGNLIDPAYQVLGIHISDEANRLAAATIILRDGDPASAKFELSEKDDFIPGKKIRINIGLDSDRKTLFEGIVVRHAIRARNAVSSTLTVECRHEAVKMTLGRKNKYFEDKKDSDVAEEILGVYGLKGDVAATSVTHKEIVQYYVSDWDFLVARAEMNGQLVFTDGDKISIDKPDTGSDPVLTLTYGANLLELEAELDARQQWKSVKASSWDYAGQALFEAESSAATFTEPGNLSGAALSDALAPETFEIRHTGQVLTQELQAKADAVMLKSRMSKARGRLKFTGFPGVKPGVVVRLLGCGERFNGNVYVTGVRHEVQNGSWFTDVQFGMSPEWFSHKTDIAGPPAGGLVAPVHGLQIGIAVQLENDPDGEHRVLVKLPLLDNAARGVWARVCTPDAGNERGTFFRPEIGDELIIGFLNDDPRDPVVLGMLHSSAKPAWHEAKDDNHIKGFQSRSKMKWVFDDEKNIITMETPAGNKFVISEDEKSITLQDQNGNSLKMNDSGIEIKSIKDIKIEAAANMEAKAGMNFKAEGSVNAELKAGASLKAAGTAAAEFSSTGATILKGMPIKIN